ncbi:MAG TPA: hypothetical protein VFS78_03670, partial [Vicinamibacteria bacterium]|nr:hypothetical protein [Vicinamibacteria bacterium]
GSERTLAITAPAVRVVPSRRPIVEPTSPERYRVQFTIGKESHDKLRRLQALLRREIPDGDPGAIFDRALTLLLEKVERTKLGAAAKPRPPHPTRPGTDEEDWRRVPASRHTPSHVKRAAWRRDGGQCGFVAQLGQRCTERTFLEFHHIQPYAQVGDSPRSRTSRFAVAATTNTRPSWCLARTVLRSKVRGQPLEAP